MDSIHIWVFGKQEIFAALPQDDPSNDRSEVAFAAVVTVFADEIIFISFKEGKRGQS